MLVAAAWMAAWMAAMRSGRSMAGAQKAMGAKRDASAGW